MPISQQLLAYFATRCERRIFSTTHITWSKFIFIIEYRISTCAVDDGKHFYGVPISLKLQEEWNRFESGSPGLSVSSMANEDSCWRFIAVRMTKVGTVDRRLFHWVQLQTPHRAIQSWNSNFAITFFLDLPAGCAHVWWVSSAFLHLP